MCKDEETNHKRGERHHAAKLTEKDVVEIRRLINDLDMCCACVKKLLGLESSTHSIWEAAKGITWKHIP